MPTKSENFIFLYEDLNFYLKTFTPNSISFTTNPNEAQIFNNQSELLAYPPFYPYLTKIFL